MIVMPEITELSIVFKQLQVANVCSWQYWWLKSSMLRVILVLFIHWCCFIRVILLKLVHFM